MEEDNETLDWGQEDEEQQAVLRKASFDQSSRRDFADQDDIEDTVSLGEDEDEPIYYNQPQDAPRSAHDTPLASEISDRPPSSQRRSDDSGANSHRDFRYRDVSREDEYRGTSSSRDSYRPAESSPSQRRSANQSSPRPHQNGNRITHALPPKPALAQVPYLPPSHPSMVEAIGMASTSMSPPSRSNMRDPKKLNGSHARSRSPMQSELPPGWEKRHSRHGGHIYYYHPETEETTWDFPVSKIPSTSSHGGYQRRRRPSASSGHMNLTSPDSNNHHSQNSRPRQQLPHQPQEKEDHANPAPSDPDGLSYEDRHYRPGGADPASAALEIKVPERLDGSALRSHVRSRYDKSPSPSRHRRRPRSMSPQPEPRGPRGPANERDYSPPRGNGRSVRDRNVNTNPDHVSHREIDAMPSQPEFPNRRWESSSNAPVSDFSRGERNPRRPPHRDEDDYMREPRSSDNRNRPSLRRRESSRGPRDRDLRDREPSPPPRPSDNRRDKPSESQNYISAPRYRSPPRLHERERESARNFGPPPSDTGPYAGPPSQTRRDRDRLSRFEQSGPTGPPPPVGGGPSHRGNEQYAGRPRNYDPPANFDQPRHREERARDMEPERSRRDPMPDVPTIRPPPPNSYPVGEPNRMSVDRAKRFTDDYSQAQARPEEPPHHRRAPLPPQNQSFTTSIVPGHEHDKFPYRPGWANGDPTLPKQPRYDNERALQGASDVPYRPPGPRSERQTPNIRDPPHRAGPPQSNNMANEYDRAKPSNYPPASTFESKEYSGPSDSYRRERRDPSPPRHGPGNALRQPPPSIPIPRGDVRSDNRQGPVPVYQSAFSDRNSFNDRRDQDNQRDGRTQWKDNRPGNAYPDRNMIPPRRDMPNRSIDAPPPRHLSGGPVSGTNNVPIGTRRPGPPGYAQPPPSGPASQPMSEMKPPYNPDARPPPPHDLRRRESTGNMGSIRGGDYVEDPDTRLTDERRRQFYKAKEEAATRAAQSRISVNEQRPSQDYAFGNQATSPPLSREPSAMSVTSDHLPPRPPARDLYDSRPDNRSDNRPRGPSDSYSKGAQYHSPNIPPRSEPSKADPPVEIPAPNEPPKEPRHDQQRQNRERGPTRWGPEVKQSNEQPNEQPPTSVRANSPPALARRMSSERPPRLRKYPGGSATTTGADNDLRGGGSSSNNTAPSDSGMPVDDFKDRPEPNRPTLLDRISEDNTQPSLRDRLVPSKRDHDDLDNGHPRDSSYDMDDGNDNKRVRRRNPKGNRRGGGGGRRIIS
ncbi:hypothetical protein JR316_0009671 [Psilocybe cubensis]|uniref:Uncharacterized protein n=1 Tax=Psilocybe cubensis TaxID=181762 RepID=A0ACB8GP86_PSICU|nr:hypothetical protein JR316_0009671 [Psilocybe cubensis]KAH9477458.1 hypothetical protein JR316_0009671 [Psilocybe cubensis]